MPDCNEEGIAILRDGVFVHEAEAICRRLEKAGIQFGVRQISQEDAGIVDPLYCICLDECYWTPRQFPRHFARQIARGIGFRPHLNLTAADMI